MDDRVDSPLTDEERVLAERGASLVATAVASSEAQAPAHLRERLEAQRAAVGTTPARPGVARRWSPRWIAGVAALLIAVGGTVAVGLQAGSDLPGGPDVLRVATITRLAPTGPAPDSLGGLQPKLDAEVEGVAFPDWRAEFDWEAVGQRSDELGGRALETVTYRNPEGVTVGYSIVAGAALAAAEGDAEVTRRGTTYRVFRRGGRTTVAWEERGHTCVLDAPPSVPVEKLVDLAAWDNV